MTSSCPMPRADVIDRYFMEHRAKLLDVAAFLDRVDRAPDAEGPDDFRLVAMRRAIGILAETEPHRAKRILECFSDPTEAPISSAAGMKGAHGAFPGSG